MEVSRRKFLKSIAAASGAGLLSKSRLAQGASSLTGWQDRLSGKSRRELDFESCTYKSCSRSKKSSFRKDADLVESSSQRTAGSCLSADQLPGFAGRRRAQT